MSAPEKWRRWGVPVPRSDIEREVVEELEYHLEKKVERLQQQGFDEARAREEAARRFGDFQRIQNECVGLSVGRERKRMRIERLGDLGRDLRFAFRTLGRRPGFSAAAILTIALGLGAVTSIFSLFDAVLIRALPYDEPDRLASVWGPFQSEAVYLGLSELEAFDDVAAMTQRSLTLTGGELPMRVDGSGVTPNFFSLLRAQPVAGRPLIAEDAAADAEAVTVLSERLAKRLFGTTSDALGERLLLEGEPYEVVGVVADAIRLPNADTQLWLPMRIEAAASGNHWGNYYLQLLARLAPESSYEDALLQVRERAQRLRLENPIWTPDENFAASATMDPLQTTMAGDLRRVLSLLMLASLAVLLVACVNVANLLLARSAARSRELAIRSSLGAGRARLLRSLLIESLVIASLGAGIGILIARGALSLLVSELPSADARFGAIGLDGRVLVFTLGTTVLTALLFGFLPAWVQSRANLVAQMSPGTRGGGSASRRLSRTLVVGQLALSVILTFSAGLVLKSLWELWSENPGFQSESVVLARLDPASADYEDPDRRVALYRDVVSRLEASPGVTAVAATTIVPMGAHGMSVFDAPSLDIDPNDLPVAIVGDVTPGYFETLGLPLLEGRDFGVRDERRACPRESPCATIVNRSLADRMFQGEALGEVIGAGFLGWFEIVGLVADARLETLSAEPTMTFFLPHAQRQLAPVISMELVVRSNRDPRDLGTLIESAVHAIDPQVPVDNVRTLDSVVRGSVNDTRFLASLLAVFASVSLVLGAIGIYGVISYVVEGRRHEMGVRAALGATPNDLRRRVLLDAMGLALLGTLLGVLGSFATSRFLESELYETTTRAPAVLLSVALILFAAATLAAWLPARRAAGVDPVVTLREE